jgi:glycosyltransferase involved in cell wall biosynthesis
LPCGMPSSIPIRCERVENPLRAARPPPGAVKMSLFKSDFGSLGRSDGYFWRRSEAVNAFINTLVRYVEHDGHCNRGMSASRNAGLRNAWGTCIAFLDADDVLLPQALERQVATLGSWPEAGMVYGTTQYWHSWAGTHANGRHDFYDFDFGKGRGLRPNTLIYPPTLLARFLQDSGAVPCMCSLLVRREVIEGIGGFEERFRGMYEDQAFYAKVALKVPVVVMSECWSRYRQHPDSCCSIAERTNRAHTARLLYLNWLMEYLSEHDISYAAVWHALRQELRPYRHPAMHRLVGLTQQFTQWTASLPQLVARRLLPRPVQRALWRVKQHHASLQEVQYRVETSGGNIEVSGATMAAESPARDPHPLVSVIIPCYNQGQFLGEAIESTLAQTHPYVEIIVVDDGSMDQTAEVATHYPSVRRISQTNQGLAAARNTGLRQSTGSYLVFLDADDRLLPGALATGLRYLGAHSDCMFVSGHHRLIARDGSILRESVQEPIDDDRYAQLLRGNYIAMHATVMYRRAVFAAVGQFDESLQACEDYDLFFRITRAFPVGRHADVVAEYRKHGANMTANSARMLRQALAVLRAQWRYVNGDRYYRRAYRMGLRSWKRYYGRQLVKDVLARFGQRAWMPALRGTFTLLRYYPRGTVDLSVRIVRAVFTRVASTWHRRSGPPLGRVRFGSLRRVTPISPDFGYGRGGPIDRYYIEQFLGIRRDDICGRVLEIGDDSYTRKFGGSSVTRRDVLHVTDDNPRATIIADLASADHIPDNTFDCIILTQTLQVIYEVRAAIATLHRILKPGGVLLATFPGISQIDRSEWRESWYWSFTTRSARRLFEETFSRTGVKVEAHGNVLVTTAFLYGLGVGELRREELDYHDPQYEMLITVRAAKSALTR